MVTAEQLAHTLPEVYTPTQHQADMDEKYEDSVSADYDTEYPKMALSSKPKNFTSVLATKRTRKGQRPPKDRNNNPCLKNEYRGYCVHGVCQYLKELNLTSCICNEGYTGERCHFFSLPVGKDDVKDDNTTALAVTAAVLSLTCLTIIGILLAIRLKQCNRVLF
ncbi:heparin-binding EGF-like growth factor b [Trichomycterus rosablanca]|uniref:heparin-binding EGF-like growth factor b n=1 Tax=Trichomycterus rosablanca TaxID=2290929 RepID=UPI002F360884